jgi:hypothetical protein
MTKRTKTDPAFSQIARHQKAEDRFRDVVKRLEDNSGRNHLRTSVIRSAPAEQKFAPWRRFSFRRQLRLRDFERPFPISLNEAWPNNLDSIRGTLKTRLFGWPARLR